MGIYTNAYAPSLYASSAPPSTDSLIELHEDAGLQCKKPA
ncbi:hypothetical protein AVEN_146370-1, partial [Araneus ventricosus]